MFFYLIKSMIDVHGLPSPFPYLGIHDTAIFTKESISYFRSFIPSKNRVTSKTNDALSENVCCSGKVIHFFLAKGVVALLYMSTHLFHKSSEEENNGIIS
jgi:hypothetical protein